MLWTPLSSSDCGLNHCIITHEAYYKTINLQLDADHSLLHTLK
ncbi:hypothetical protein TGAM01_v210837 [Trichoderma gamsii]|uniref:Uncharacterized protein n=1 Tax=Trichoderma gamsii TaxID=398673 RepID=A0A2P4Z7M0_9HYPO|nr:hypothetical protein TGAM01_v210837 [Trichoderma gamsii]PON20286.1 hypothetical protein TGAM01_v210837 [Trichoderma gamsii]